MLTFSRTDLNAFRDLLQQGRLLSANVGELSFQSSRFLANQHRIHHHLTSYRPESREDVLIFNELFLRSRNESLREHSRAAPYISSYVGTTVIVYVYSLVTSDTTATDFQRKHRLD